MDLTQQFMAALRQTEQTRDPAPLLALYAPESTTQNLSEEVYHGVGGARTFWQRYLDTFQDVQSTFEHVLSTPEAGVMEWEASGTLQGGRAIRYRGVSVIECQDGKVVAFRTYYDTAAFINPG